MPIVFPESDNYEIQDERFLCSWKHVVEMYGPEQANANPLAVALPRLNAHQTFAQCIENHQQFSLDYLCRNLVPNGYRNTMQATPAFMQDNGHLLLEMHVQNPLTGLIVNGARLIQELPKVISLKQCPDEIEVLFETDCDDLAESVLIAKSRQAYAPTVSRAEFLTAFVEQLHRECFVPMYRGRAFGMPVLGWPNRLRSYFWPTPNHGYQLTNLLNEILATADRLAMSAGAGPWDDNDQHSSVALASNIFDWGGVPQAPAIVTAQNIRSVFDAAINATVPAIGVAPPMNSGWTKVAAFASAHLENIQGRHPQVIWDSRVSTSILSRLDRLLSEADFATIPDFFSDIGLIGIGRGGTRPRTLNLAWPNGYMSWPAQLAASKLVAEIRDVLNNRPEIYGLMPALDPLLRDVNTRWTVRGVEMVLFMDGY